MDDFSVTTIDILRHGHCDDGEIFRGRTDSELSVSGWQQMQNTIEGNSIRSWQVIISSPMQRCSQYAQQLAKNLNINCICIADFQEIDFGDWEGQSPRQLTSDSGLLQSYWKAPHLITPPNGESLSDFHKRVGAAWQQLLLEQKGKKLLLVTHGGVIRSILAHCLNATLSSLQRFSVPHACISQIKIFHSDNEPDWLQLIHHTPPAEVKNPNHEPL